MTFGVPLRWPESDPKSDFLTPKATLLTPKVAFWGSKKSHFWGDFPVTLGEPRKSLFESLLIFWGSGGSRGFPGSQALRLFQRSVLSTAGSFGSWYLKIVCSLRKQNLQGPGMRRGAWDTEEERKFSKEWRARSGQRIFTKAIHRLTLPFVQIALQTERCFFPINFAVRTRYR